MVRSMGKRTRRHNKTEPKRRRLAGEPDHVAELPFGYMARWGRFITMRGTSSTEEHAAMVGAFVAGADEIRHDQEARRARLLEVLEEADPVDLIARASLTYLRIDPNTFKEWESDRSPAHVEYLALQALGMGLPGPRDVDPMREAEFTWEAIEVVREMFQSASMLMVMEAAAAHRDRPDDCTIEYRLKTRLESLGVRGTGYSEHLRKVIHACLDPFDGECRDLLGFTATDALALTHAVAEVISDRMEPRWREAAAGRDEMLRQLKHERRHPRGRDRHFPDWLLDLPPTKARMHVSMFSTTWLFADSRSLAVVTPGELAASAAVDESVAFAFLDAFTCTPDQYVEEHHAFPGGGHPLITRPILRLKDGYIVPVPSSLVDAIRPRMEDLLQQTGIWDRYTDGRGKYLEREAATLLSSAIPGSRSWTSIAWQSTDSGSDLDGLVAADDLTARLQCKAGRLTAPARRGAPGRMKRDIGDLIEAAAEQHASLAAALDSEGAQAIGFSDPQAAAFRAPLQLEVIVCLDDVTVWATETHGLRRLGALPADRHVPWVLSLTDLMAVTDLLQGAELIHYLVRRQRIERDGRIAAHDELDWVGHYIAEGLFFDGYFDGDDPPDRFRLLSYTEPIDAWYFTRDGVRTIDAPKPDQGVPENLRLLIRRLERERPRHWVRAAIALLDGDQESRDLWDRAITHARERVPREGWSNASQIFDGRLGVTFYVDLRTDWPAIRTKVEDYSRMKAEAENQPNWIAVGEGRSGGVFVVVTERMAALPLAEHFLEPPGRGRASDSTAMDRD